MKGCRTQSFETTLNKSFTSIELFNIVLDFLATFRENLDESMLNINSVNKLLHQAQIISKRIENFVDNQDIPSQKKNLSPPLYNIAIENELEKKLKELDAKANSFFELLEERDRENAQKEAKISELLHDLAELIRKNEENTHIIQKNRDFISELYFIIKIGEREEDEGKRKEGGGEEEGWGVEGKEIKIGIMDNGKKTREGSDMESRRVGGGKNMSFNGGIEEEDRQELGIKMKRGRYWEGMEGEIMREVNKKRVIVERIYHKNEKLSLNEDECRVCLIF